MRRSPDSDGVNRAQAEVVGVVLVLTISVVLAGSVIVYGTVVLDDHRDRTREDHVEHAMTQLDSRVALVVLGDSSSQGVALGDSGPGQFRVDSDSGWINVSHQNHSGNGDVEVLYNRSLGTVAYEDDDTIIAYQGGGVWRGRGDESVMVSPPEFHYQSATLTLPIIRVHGGDGLAGPATAKVSADGPARPIFPNSSASYDGQPDTRYENPVDQGNVTVTVKSEHYVAWADYFRTRTTGKVMVDHAAGTASVRLMVPATKGSFEMPSDGQTIFLRGLDDGHPISDFTVEIHPDDEDSADFSNLQWSLWAEQGSQQFELHLRAGTENDDPSTDDCTERYVKATVYYSDSSGDPYHGWRNDTAYTTTCSDVDGDRSNETYLVANLTAMEPRTLSSLSSSDLMHFSSTGDTWSSSATFDEHGDDVDWEDPGTTFSEGSDDQTTMYNLTNHYLSLMGPNVELTIEGKGSDTVSEDVSSGTVDYDSSGVSFITFLHITENEARIELR